MCCQKYTCTVVQSILTNSGNLSLPDSNRISDNDVMALLLRRSGSSTLKDISGRTLAADTVINTAHLKLNNKNGKELAQIPLSVLQRDYNSPAPLPVDWKEVDPTQCSIVLDTTAAGYDATHVIELIWFYPCKDCL